ncbi:lipocalin family protein [Thermodesulfobacteriota bacterium]
MNKIFLYTLIFMSLLLSSCKTMDRNNMKPLETVNFVDINRYIGEWYEIARYEHRFQKGCVGSKAIYSLRDDGKITVVNECFEKSFSGNIRSVKGKAWVVDKQSNAKLKVSFFWPFAGDYWVIDLGENYEYAVVGHPDRKYLWILSRTPEMDEKVYNEILARLEKQDYDTTKLFKSQLYVEGGKP